MHRSGSIPALFFSAVTSLATFAAAHAQSSFHGAPDATKQVKNPLDKNAGMAVAAGLATYAANCASCHGTHGEGASYIPALATGASQAVSAGELFWFITRGEPDNAMPSWVSLTDKQRWQLVSAIKSGKLATVAAPQRATPATMPRVGDTSTPAPVAPFTDYRYEAPGTSRKITVADLPPPYATDSARNGPKLVARPVDAWPKALPGFKVEMFATGLNEPRLMRTAPNGDIFVAETKGGEIRVLRGIGSDGKPLKSEVFIKRLHQPFGIAFYPPGPNPQWLYIGATDAVLRVPYRNGDMIASAAPVKLVDLPSGGHSTRDIQFSPDGKRMYVAVGSHSNVDDPDSTPAEKNRANILVFNPDGSDQRVYASGIRNPVGLVVDQKTGELWCSVNERDGLGDNLVPDYITHVEQGGFYGWPWWYIGAHQDPRHAGKHPELKDKVIVPDVLLQPHNASLEMTFYDGKQFPLEYAGDIFAAEHGSWNKATRAGYEVIRIPRGGGARASGSYTDFLTGFVLDNGDVWGRPVGVTVAADGSLLVSDDGSNSIWRVSYAKP